MEDSKGEETLSLSDTGALTLPGGGGGHVASRPEETTQRGYLDPTPVAVERRGTGTVESFRAQREAEPKFQILSRVGKGAMGEVFIARDRDLNRVVAVKRIDPEKNKVGRDVERFYTEAQITAQLDHPSIVPVHDIELDDEERLAYSMKLVRGITLTEYIGETRRQFETSKKVDEEHRLVDRLEVFLALCAAVAYAHSRGVIHRDLKPGNVMLGRFREVFVMDWGIAKVVSSGDRPAEDSMLSGELRLDNPQDTSVGTILGTPLYMSPEQARGENHLLGPASDQASLGLILYELVCLQRAYEGTDATQILLCAAEAKKRSMDRALVKTPRELAAVVHRATANRPENRYPSVEELANDVRRFIQNEEVQAAPDNPAQRLARLMSRHRGYTLSIVSSLILLMVTGSVFQVLSNELALSDERETARMQSQLLANRVGGVTAQAQGLNAALEHWQEQLSGMAYAAQLTLTSAAGQRNVYDCADPSTAPDDLRDSDVFFKPVSSSRLCVETAPGVDGASLEERMRQLMNLSSSFRRARLVSDGYDIEGASREDQDLALRQRHLPILFSYMGTREGIMATYPGRDTARDDYDPRLRPWYSAATRTRGPTWMAIDSVTRRKGLVLTGALAVRHPIDDGLLGVVAVDVEFTTLLDDLMLPPASWDPELDLETYLLDAQGAVLVQSSMRDVARELRAFEPGPFPHEELLERFRRETSGSVQIEGGGAGRLAIWSGVESTGWTLVFVGRRAELMTPRLD